jgi:hypothetical protein
MSNTSSDTAYINNLLAGKSQSYNSQARNMQTVQTVPMMIQTVPVQQQPQQLIQQQPQQQVYESVYEKTYSTRSGPQVERIDQNAANANKNGTLYRLLPSGRNANATQSQSFQVQSTQPIISSAPTQVLSVPQQTQQQQFQQVPYQQVQQVPIQQAPLPPQPSVLPVIQQVISVPTNIVAQQASANTFPTTPAFPMGTPLVPANVVDYTMGDMIMPTPNRLVKHTLYLYNNGVNPFPSFSRFILVIGNCDTSGNYQQFVDQDNLAEQYPNQTMPFSYYYQVDKSQLRFECFSSWTWNLDMNVGQNLVTNSPQINIYDEVFIYPHEKLVKTRELTRFNSLNTDLPTQYTPIFGYSNENDIFILLPDIEICYIGQKFNFYICRKVRNLYNPACLNCCEDDSCTIPVPYQALLHQYSVNIYIFASDTLNRRNHYISDNNVFDGGLMIGPRVNHSDDKSIYYLKLDNETYFNDFQCDCTDERVFSLNPRNMFDYWKVEISVVTYRNVKRFHVDTALPPYTNNYQTPITMLPTVCGGLPDVQTGLFSRGIEVGS